MVLSVLMSASIYRLLASLLVGFCLVLLSGGCDHRPPEPPPQEDPWEKPPPPQPINKPPLACPFVSDGPCIDAAAVDAGSID
jgi:hypothetical protein